MRPPPSLHENRIGGPQNFRPPVQNDFCNKIGPITDATTSDYRGSFWGTADIDPLPRLSHASCNLMFALGSDTILVGDFCVGDKSRAMYGQGRTTALTISLV